MVEHDDRFAGQEEGEYHFSDEQMNYDVEDTPIRPDEVKANSKGMLTGMQNYRRIIIGAGVFLTLLFIVYKMIAPGTTGREPSTEITAEAPALQPKQPMSATASPTAAPVVPVVRSSPPVTTVPTVQAQQSQLPTQTTVSTTTTTPQSAVQQTIVQQPKPSPSPAQTMPIPTNIGAPALVVSDHSLIPMDTGTVDNKVILEKIAALEDQNAKLTNALESEYAQKMTTYQQQYTDAQAKMEELTNRVATMEATLTQLTQSMQPPKGVAVTGTIPAAPLLSAPASLPKISYTVQAIIPGRAWLKSDNGDIVTVAEGDNLKDVGRIVKVDPYDGLVQIDTGAKIITLTYGGGGD